MTSISLIVSGLCCYINKTTLWHYHLTLVPEAVHSDRPPATPSGNNATSNDRVHTIAAVHNIIKEIPEE